MSEAFLKLFQEIQQAATPEAWSQGVRISRGDFVLMREPSADDEIALRLKQKNQALSQRVQFFLEELQWNCDCGSDDDPCGHVTASAIAYKQGKAIEGLKSTQDHGPGAARTAARLEYHFTTTEESRPSSWSRSGGVAPKIETVKNLHLKRYVVMGDQKTPLLQSLSSYMGGIQSGRLSGPPIAALKADFNIDAMLEPDSRHLERSTLLALCKMLENCPNVFLNGRPIRTLSDVVGVKARLLDEGEGWRLQRFQSLEIEDKFNLGFVLANNTLRPVEHTRLTPTESELLEKGGGQYFKAEEATALVTEILPSLQRKIPVDVLTKRLPRAVEYPPTIVLKTETTDNLKLSVVAQMTYGAPNESPLAYVNEARLQTFKLSPSGIPEVVVIRDQNEEKRLLQKLSQELQLQTGRAVSFYGSEGIEFFKRAKNWKCVGNGVEIFKTKDFLKARVLSRGPVAGSSQVDLAFEVQQGDKVFTADAQKVFRAWKEGAEVVPLLEGGWAPLPKDWLRRFGKRIQDLLSARDDNKELPPYRLPELATLLSDVGQSVPDALKKLKESLDSFEGIADYPLPLDLTANLRGYQKKGVNWLCFLRDSGLGGLLADDMGLGKTLQALCAIRGRTLVVAPTSVLHNWAAEFQKFRPSLKVSVFYGPQRKLSADADIVLTTYALVRLDQELLAGQEWETLIIDEAQTIKNPQAQVSKAVHRLRGKFRVSLSGTPIENRLDDLWSQFQFVNPGFLGSYESFQESYVRPISRGDVEASSALRQKVKPFILRRLKTQVAPELPARTETVLRCELADSEQELYEAVMAATRKDVVAKLKEGGSIMEALEALLRLRQACCHSALLPGQHADSSAKLELLADTLEESLAEGHKSLIFSQWTSYLDLIEARLRKMGISPSRIDGTTKNRAEVVQQFQSPGGPPVMLLSLKAGGVGITLTAADHVFIMDPWWNPSVEDQAADRAHRIGQQNPVMIHRLIANNTVEEKIILLQKKKQDLARAVLDGAEGGASITREDLLELFA